MPQIFDNSLYDKGNIYNSNNILRATVYYSVSVVVLPSTAFVFIKLPYLVYINWNNKNYTLCHVMKKNRTTPNGRGEQ